MLTCNGTATNKNARQLSHLECSTHHLQRSMYYRGDRTHSTRCHRNLAEHAASPLGAVASERKLNTQTDRRYRNDKNHADALDTKSQPMIAARGRLPPPMKILISLRFNCAIVVPRRHGPFSGPRPGGNVPVMTRVANRVVQKEGSAQCS